MIDESIVALFVLYISPPSSALPRINKASCALGDRFHVYTQGAYAGGQGNRMTKGSNDEE
jgi:hypothetical protein